MTNKTFLLQGIAMLVISFIVWAIVVVGIFYANTHDSHEREVIVNGR